MGTDAVRSATLTQKKMLFQSKRMFKQGERNGKLLAWLAKEQTPISAIANIEDASGALLRNVIIRSSERIINFLVFYYQTL